MPANDFDRMVDIIDSINKSLSSSGDNINETIKAQRQYAEALRTATLEAVDSIRQTTSENETVLKEAVEKELRVRSEAEKKIKEAREAELRTLEEKSAIEEALRTDEGKQQEKYLRDKQQQLDRELLLNQERQRIEEARLSGDNELYQRLIIEQELRLRNEEEINRSLQEEVDKRKSNVKRLGELADNLFNEVTRTYTQAISNVSNIYNQEAGKMSALLNTTVTDISQLQRRIADELRSDGLSKAISNVAVLSEASSLVSAGYTDTTTLQQNAVDIAIGREIAPTADFNNATVKSLINIFGSDFTHKFTAIQQAAQETAGSAINISSNLSTLMTNLEPVYQNAQYQAAALQGSADVTATLANAREQGIITQSQEREYMTMLTELMDPSKAFKSNNLAVKVASTQYDYSSGDPAQALQALINAQRQYYGNFDQSNSYMGNVGRSLGASVAGNDTMSATYNAQGLTDLTMLSASDLDTTYNEQLSKLQSGNFTTATEENQNRAENSAITQTVATFAKDFPRIFTVMQTAILGAIQALPSTLGNRLGGLFSRDGSSTSVTGSGGVVGNSNDASTNGSRTLGNSVGSGRFNFSNLNTRTFGDSGNLANRVSRSVGGRIGGLSMASYGAGIIGATNVIGSVAENGFNAQGLGMNGDVGSSMLSYGGMGAAIGSLIAPGLGTAIGAVVGGLAGLATALWAQNEQEQQNTAAMEALTQSTKDVLGPGVQSLSALEAKREVARGGGTIDLNSGTYALDMNVPKAATGMDYVPYDDYLVRLHKGEAVVTATAAQSLRRANPNFWNVPVSRNDDVIFELEKQTQSIVGALKGDTDLLPMQQQGPKMYNIPNIN